MTPYTPHVSKTVNTNLYRNVHHVRKIETEIIKALKWDLKIAFVVQTNVLHGEPGALDSCGSGALHTAGAHFVGNTALSASDIM